MDGSKDKQIKIYPVFILGLVILGLIWLLEVAVRSRSSHVEETYRMMNNSWNVAVKGVEYHNIDLRVFSVDGLKRNDSVRLSRTLTDDLDGGMTIRILTQCCSLEVYVGDDLLYSYGTEEVRQNTIVGSGYHFIDLPDECDGKILDIYIRLGEDNVFKFIPSIAYAKGTETYLRFADDSAINLVIGGFLIVAGIVLVLVGFAMIFFKRELIRIIATGAFSVSMGVWCLCYYYIPSLFTINKVLTTNAQYLSIFVAPIFIGLIFWDMRRKDEDWRSVVILIVTTIFIDFAVVASVLHFTDTVHFFVTTPFFRLLGSILTTIVVLSGLLGVKYENHSDAVVSADVLLFAVIVAAELLRYSIAQELFVDSVYMQTSFLTSGAFVITILFIAGDMAHLYEIILSKARSEWVQGIADHDSLTGLLNRVMSYEAFGEIEKNNEEVAIICIDIDRFSEVNEKFGHDEGDRVLCRIAGMIERCFDGLGSFYRTGGDEFMVIVRQSKTFDINSALERFEDKLRIASETSEYSISASYGVAYSNEVENKAVVEVSRLADTRMREAKHKKAEG